MPISNVSVGYRPVKIAFLIKEGSLTDFIQCCKINTILWGGIFNPIIPVGTNLAPAQGLIDSFQVDILLPFSTDPQIDILIKKNEKLTKTSRFTKDLFHNYKW